MKHRPLLHRICAMLLVGLPWAQALPAQAVSHIQVRVETGATDLTAGSLVELRIYLTNKSVLRLPLTHGEAWPRDSSRIIPLTLREALDPASVVRFGLYYRAASAFSPAWEVVAADVDLSGGHPPPDLLLGATLFGEIAKQGELATEAREGSALTCRSDADCDDHRACNGRERCAPRSTGADARGCARGTPQSCPVNQVCAEGRGCVGASSLKAPASN